MVRVKLQKSKSLFGPLAVIVRVKGIVSGKKVLN